MQRWSKGSWWRRTPFYFRQLEGICAQCVQLVCSPGGKDATPGVESCISLRNLARRSEDRAVEYVDWTFAVLCMSWMEAHGVDKCLITAASMR